MPHVANPTQCRPLQVSPVGHLPHTPPHPLLPQVLPTQFATHGLGGGAAACAALCFFAFFRHFFFASPDFFLQALRGLWAAASSDRTPSRPSDPASAAANARRREPAPVR